MKSLLKVSGHINYYRLLNQNASAIKSAAILLAGALDVFSAGHFHQKKWHKVTCNACNWQGRKFLNFYVGYGYIYRNAICPHCYSQPRHRAYYAYLKKLLSSIDREVKVLHFAPEEYITQLLKSYSNVDYLSVDIDPSRAMRKEDITKLSFKDESFDIIICIHVFEHINDDKAAMREVYRVLKTDGQAVLDVPIDINRATTFEDPTITSSEARTKAYWFWDHVRLYGMDFKDKLAAVGFKVTEDEYVASLGQEFADKHGIENNTNYLCTK